METATLSKRARHNARVYLRKRDKKKRHRHAESMSAMQEKMKNAMLQKKKKLVEIERNPLKRDGKMKNKRRCQ